MTVLVIGAVRREEVVSSPRQGFQSLEVGRGVAAAMVALSHALILAAEPRWFGTVPFGGTFANMNVGVDYFFVLSGFLITFVHWQDFGRPDRLARYARRRFTRIFPPYWIILTAVVPVYLAVPSFGVPHQHDWLDIVASYLLLPMPQQPVLGVAWTLTFEVFFYLLLGLVIVMGRRALPLLVVWGAVIALCQLLGLRTYPASFFGNTYGIEFMLGMGAAAWLRRRRIPFPGLLFAAGLGLFFGATFLAPTIQLADDGAWARLVFGPAAALILIGSVELERSGRLAVPSWLVPLGSASYAIYLTHVVTESALMRGAMHLNSAALGAGAMALLLAAAGVIGGFAFHFAVERPVLRLVRRWLA